MPLIIALIAIVVVINWAFKSEQKNSNLSTIRGKDRQKTNAQLEQHILDTYMKHGYSFNDAFNQAVEDVVAAGYVPCIPRTAYEHNRRDVESSYCGLDSTNVKKYDSFWVRRRRGLAEKEWQQAHPGVFIGEAPQEEIDCLTYSNFPTTDLDYELDLRRCTIRDSAIPIGSYVFHPKFGTCEVLAHNWKENGSYGFYTLKVVETGEIVNYINIGNKSLKQQ